MSYIYHLKPNPFVGDSLVPLNLMDHESDLYKKNAAKYQGREELMNEIIPTLNCKWNDVVQFSSIDPQILFDELAKIQENNKTGRREYFKIHKDQILDHYPAVVFDRKTKLKGQFGVNEEDIACFSTYKEINQVPQDTIDYWRRMQEAKKPMLLFPFVPHIFVKGIIDTSNFEVCTLRI
jgi:hypothetical protein